MTPSLQNQLNSSKKEVVKIWVFFKDKATGKHSLQKMDLSHITAKALKRRAKTSSTKQHIDSYDLPVSEIYINQIKPFIINVGVKSRWMNAVSVTVKKEYVNKLNALACVAKLSDVKFYLNKREQHAASPTSFSAMGLQKTGSGIDYGASLGQLEQIGVIALHEKSLSGKGVTIAMLDNGYNRYKTHKVFNNLKVIGTWDFINNDEDVDDPDAQINIGRHGTTTLSVIGGFTPGQLIGPAYNANYLLAKTEVDSFEKKIEEDYWVAGLEWAEAQGADIVNSSLGYGHYATDPATSWYTWQQMDGKTAITTLATDIAEQKGVIVVTSAGNEGQNPGKNSLAAPADGKYVITVGGVMPNNTYWSVASHGPTADGRIKPNVAAQGSSVRIASSYSNTQFVSGNGTSYAAPLVAGAIALLLEADSTLTPAQVRQAIHKTASHGSAPDNFTGYGILNINKAYMYVKNGFVLPGSSAKKPTANPNPFNDFTAIKYAINTPSYVEIEVFNALGQRVVRIPKYLAEQSVDKRIYANQLQSSGIYYYMLKIDALAGKGSKKVYGKFIYLK